MIKAKPWKGNDLLGSWLVTSKIDGVRALKDEQGVVTSRNGKPLYNLDHLDFTDAEIYFGSWEDSVSAVRTHGGNPVPKECVYSLAPLDDRLIIGNIIDPTAEEILQMLKDAKANKLEGLVLRNEDDTIWLKVKDKETYDVAISGVQPGTGKHTGRMGALLTPMGKVGTGFSDKEREEEWNVGDVIEVECMELTCDGKFRHPRFIRRRFDK